MTRVAMTVDGKVDVDLLGATLIHEHLHLDARPLLANLHGFASTDSARLSAATAAEARWNPGHTADNYDLTDVDLIVDELRYFTAASGHTIVDVTPTNLGRSPLDLRRMSQVAGVQILMGGGYYLAATQPDAALDASAEDLADRLTQEFRVGVDDTGVRPGIIGEIGTGAVLAPAEAKMLRAAAWAQPLTGLPISVHLHPWSKIGHDVLDVLLGESVRPQRIVLGHLNPVATDAQYVRSLLDRGVYGAFDLFGFDHSLLALGRYPPSDYDVVESIAELIELGYGAQLLVSHDVGVRTRLHRFGGWGYDHVLVHVVPLMERLGIAASDAQRLIVANPHDVLALDPELFT